MRACGCWPTALRPTLDVRTWPRNLQHWRAMMLAGNWVMGWVVFESASITSITFPGTLERDRKSSDYLLKYLLKTSITFHFHLLQGQLKFNTSSHRLELPWMVDPRNVNGTRPDTHHIRSLSLHHFGHHRFALSPIPTLSSSLSSSQNGYPTPPFSFCCSGGSRREQTEAVG